MRKGIQEIYTQAGELEKGDTFERSKNSVISEVVGLSELTDGKKILITYRNKWTMDSSLQNIRVSKTKKFLTDVIYD